MNGKLFCSSIFLQVWGPHQVNCFQARPEPSLCLSGVSAWPRMCKLALYFNCPGRDGLIPSSVHLQRRENKEMSGRSWQALPPVLWRPSAPTHTHAGTVLCSETGTRLPFRAAFQCESQNCHTNRRGKTEKRSKHSRHLLSTYCLPIPGVAWL